MNKNVIINRFKDKFTLLTIIGTIVMFILIFLFIKNEFFYNAVQYFDHYLDYYIKKFLNGDISRLFIDNNYLLYIESDTQNIFSSLYLYVASFGNFLFTIYTFIMPILIFYKISKVLYGELYNKYCIPQITRTSKKKYVNKTIISELIHSVTIIILPKVIYLLILSIFFPVGTSYTHAIVNVSYITNPFLYNGYVYSPQLLILVDLILTCIYAMVISLMSIFIICFFKNKSLSFLMFITTTLITSFIMYILRIVPIIYYNSLFGYFSLGFTKNLYEPLLMGGVQLLLWFIATKMILKRKVDLLV